jgi:hypothetical protein
MSILATACLGLAITLAFIGLILLLLRLGVGPSGLVVLAIVGAIVLLVVIIATAEPNPDAISGGRVGALSALDYAFPEKTLFGKVSGFVVGVGLDAVLAAFVLAAVGPSCLTEIPIFSFPVIYFMAKNLVIINSNLQA